MKLGRFAGGLALVLIASAHSPAQDAKPKITDPKLRAAVAKFEEALVKFNEGDPAAFLACWSKREDTTLLGAVGGYSNNGLQKITEAVKPVSAGRKGKEFKNTFEYVSVVETRELAFVVWIERRVAPTAEQQQSATPALRSTHIFRMEDGDWKLIHRHSDMQVERKKREEKK